MTEQGRITHGDLGIWSDLHAQALAPVTEFLKNNGAIPGIQLAHAGRKASRQRPWYGNGPLNDADLARGDHPWSIVAPSPESFTEGWLVPQEATASDIHAIIDAFATAAAQCRRRRLRDRRDPRRPRLSHPLLPLTARPTTATTPMAATASAACGWRWKWRRR